MKLFHTFLLLLPVSLFATPDFIDDEMRQRYITTYQDIAVREMHRSGIPASITLAQGILESQWGQGPLATGSQNHFGIKCKTEWTGPRYLHEDDDYENGKLIKSCFRAYDFPEDSYIDHTNFLVGNARYAELFTLDRTDYAAWARGLRQCGYATDQAYAGKLIRIIEENNLAQYDYFAETVVQPLLTTATDSVLDPPVLFVPADHEPAMPALEAAPATKTPVKAFVLPADLAKQRPAPRQPVRVEQAPVAAKTRLRRQLRARVDRR